MGLPRDRVLADGHTPHAWERQAIEFIKSALPNENPYYLWALVELVEPSGRRHEIDALVLGHNALYLVEIKSHPARFAGNSVNWTYSFFDDRNARSRVMENPMIGAGRKARALAGLLDREFRGRRPRVEPLVFLSDEKVDVSGLDAAGRMGVVTRKTFVRAITQAEFDGAQSSLQDRNVDLNAARETVQTLRRLGILESKGQRRYGDLLIEEVFDEGLGYQDHLAKAESIERLVRRVRVYLVAQSSTAERQDQLKRAATREARILIALSHPHVLKCIDFTAAGPTGEPCLVFEHDPAFERLDRYIQQRPGLSFADRMTIVRQVGEAVGYCHQRKVLHRGIDPTSVLVRGGGDDGPIDTRLFNFQLAQHTDTRGTVHLSALSDMVIYRAPELLDDPEKADEQSDVFSLGALAWFVFVGRAPAEKLGDRQRQLLHDGKLSLASAGEELASLKVERKRGEAAKYNTLDDLIGFATEVSRDARCDAANEFVDLLGHILLADEDDRPPVSDAVSGDVVRADDGTEFLVEKLLGTGSTARVFRVSSADLEGALKVALEPGFDERLEAEARLLDRARGDRIVGLKRTLRFQGRCALLLEDAGESLSAVLARSGPAGLDQARRWGDDLLRAAERLEEFGVVHKDIKPANIGFVQRDAKGAKHLMLFDFSLAQAAEHEVLVGTPPYRDPSLLDRGRWDAAADRWSVAFTLYEMLTGRLPRWVDDVALRDDAEVAIEAERFDPAVRDALTAFFRQSLARDVAKRFPSAEAMRETWTFAFVPRSVTSPPVTLGGEAGATPTDAPEKVEHVWSAATLAAIRDGTPVEALPLSNRAKNALDREGILAFGNLRKVSRTNLGKLKGLGRETVRELVEFREAWRRAHDAEVTPTAPTPASPAVAPTPDTVAGWLAAFVPAKPRVGGGKAWIVDVRAMFGLDGEEPVDASQLARRRGVSRQAVYIHVGEARSVWSKTPLLPTLHQIVQEALAATGGVAPVGALAAAVARACGASQAEDLDAPTRSQSMALIEIARMTDETLADGVLHDARWIATDRALIDVARALGSEADRLSGRDVLPSADEARGRLGPLVVHCDLARLGVERLLPLAASASTRAACSARLELYPRGMPAERALRLCAGVFTEREYDEARLRNVVASRYREALPLPARPALDALVTSVLTFRYDEAQQKYCRPLAAEIPSSLTYAPAVSRPVVARPAQPSAAPRAVSFDDAAARDFDDRLRVAAQRRTFRVINVAPVDAPVAAQAVGRRLDVPVQSLDKLLWKSLRDLAEREGVDWSVIVDADRQGPRGEDWETLRDLVREAAQTVLDRWSAEKKTLVLRDLGLAARFGLRDFVEGLAALARRDDGPAVFVVLARLGHDGEAPIDGGALPALPLPNPTAAPRLTPPETWIKAVAG
ncbi:MAG: protein kinase [Deltaproteobacteria bacterium]|nr:protein kinase [Deltaproteobacteria bacterium]